MTVFMDVLLVLVPLALLLLLVLGLLRGAAAADRDIEAMDIEDLHRAGGFEVRIQVFPGDRTESASDAARVAPEGASNHRELPGANSLPGNRL